MNVLSSLQNLSKHSVDPGRQFTFLPSTTSHSYPSKRRAHEWIELNRFQEVFWANPPCSRSSESEGNFSTICASATLLFIPLNWTSLLCHNSTGIGLCLPRLQIQHRTCFLSLWKVLFPDSTRRINFTLSGNVFQLVSRRFSTAISLKSYVSNHNPFSSAHRSTLRHSPDPWIRLRINRKVSIYGRLLKFSVSSSLLQDNFRQTLFNGNHEEHNSQDHRQSVLWADFPFNKELPRNVYPSSCPT